MGQRTQFISRKGKRVLAVVMIASCMAALVLMLLRNTAQPPVTLVFDKLIHSEYGGYQLYVKAPEKLHPNPNADRFGQFNQTTLHLAYEHRTNVINNVHLARVLNMNGGHDWLISLGSNLEGVKSYRIDHLTKERYGKRWGKFLIPFPPWSSTRRFTSGELLLDTNEIEFLPNKRESVQ